MIVYIQEYAKQVHAKNLPPVFIASSLKLLQPEKYTAVPQNPFITFILRLQVERE